MEQSYDLRQFIDEILRTGGAAQAGRIPAPTREGLEQEFKAVALRAAHRLFGEKASLEILLEEPMGEVRVFQRLRATEAVKEPSREIALDEFRAMKSCVTSSTTMAPTPASAWRPSTSTNPGSGPSSPKS